MHRSLLYILSFFILFSLGTKAAPGQSQPTEVELWFLFLDESEGAFHIKTASGYELLSATPYAVKDSYTFAPGERVELFKEVKIVTEQGERERMQKISEFSAPEGMESALAVLAPVSGGDGVSRFELRFFEEPHEESAVGSIQLINLGRTQTAAALGSSRVVLSPGESKVIPAPTDERNRLKIQVADKLGGDWEIIERRVVFLRPGEKMTGVFIYSPSGMEHTYSRGELMSLGGTLPPKHAWLQFKH